MKHMKHTPDSRMWSVISWIGIAGVWLATEAIDAGFFVVMTCVFTLFSVMSANWEE